MLDRGLAMTFRNFATLFFVCAVITVPLHVAYGIAFQNEIGVRELHSQIEEFPPLREVKGVSKNDLDFSRKIAAVLAVVELALLPLGVKAARKVFADDAAERVTDARAAWAAAVSRGDGPPRSRAGSWVGVAVSAAILALTIGFLCDRLGILVAEPISPTYAFAVTGLATGLSRAVAAPFFLGPVAYALQKKSFAPDAP